MRYKTIIDYRCNDSIIPIELEYLLCKAEKERLKFSEPNVSRY